MKSKLGVKENRPLADFLPTLTIAAKNLATEMTNYKVKKQSRMNMFKITLQLEICLVKEELSLKICHRQKILKNWKEELNLKKKSLHRKRENCRV